MKRLLTPKQVARAMGVSESSLKRWCDRGMLATTKTGGGHRRLPLDDVLRFLRDTGTPLVRPEELGLPPTTGQGETVIARSVALMQRCLEAGDEELCRRVVYDLYLAGHRAVVIFDQVIAQAFHNVGDRWECGELEVYEERRACEVCMHVLHELRAVLPVPTRNRPLALGGTLEGDTYMLPNAMVETALREADWQAVSLGTSLTGATFAKAIEDIRPRLAWLSVSHVADEARFLSSYEKLRQMAAELNVALAVGGRALDEGLRSRMQFSLFGKSIGQLIEALPALEPTSGTPD